MYHIVKLIIYLFLRLLMNVSLSFCFRHIVITAYKKVKHKKTVMFVSNHQNTFMDGLVLIKAATNIRPHILTRADIFKSKWAAIALDLLHLIPIYRKKDNMGSVSQNNAIFEKCVDLFKKNQPLLIFPEGNHAIERFLRPLQKGPARIAFQAEEEHQFDLGLTVAPFGINYENHPERWQDLQIHFGNPFEVKNFQEAYEENTVKANKHFTDRIRHAISSEMIDIKWHEEYDLMEKLRLVLRPYAIKWANNKRSTVHAENELIERLTRALQTNTDKLVSIKTNIKAYFESLQDLQLSGRYVSEKDDLLKLALKTIRVILGFPIWMAAKLINFIPEYIIERKIIERVKDKTWHISLRAGISMFLYPAYYSLVFLIMGFTIGWLQSAIIIASFPIMSVIMYETEYHFRKLKEAAVLLKNPQILQQEKNLTNDIKVLLN